MSYSAVSLPEMDLNISQTSWFCEFTILITYFLFLFFLPLFLKSPFHVVASVSQFIAPLGCILAGVVIDTRGRRYALLASMIPAIFGWLLLYLNNNIITIYAGRLLTGINVGANYYPSQAYANECILVNSDKMRRSFMAWTGIAFTIGTFLTYLLGYFYTYTEISFIATIFSLITTGLLIVFIPESPSWLYYSHRIDEAKLSERKLGIYQPILHSDEVIEEVPFTWGWSAIDIGLKKLSRSDVYKPLITFSFLFFVLTATGGPVLIGYTVDIIGGNAENSYLFSIASGAILVIGNLITCFAVQYFTVRILATYSAFVMAVGMALIGYTSLNEKSQTMYFLHLMAVWLSTFAYGFCLSNQPRMLLGQVFPIDAKGFASIPAIIVSLVAGCSTDLHPYLQLMFGGYEYYIYTSICLINAICMNLFLPSSVDDSLKKVRKYSSLE